MAKCILCETDVTGVGRCDYCGLHVIHDLGDEKRIIEKQADDHRMKILSRIKAFGVKAYQYEIKEDDLDKKEHYITVLPVGENFEDEVTWSNQFGNAVKFDLGCAEVDLQLYIETMNNERISFSATLEPPRIDGHWYLGLKLNKNLNLEIYLGNKDNHTKVDDLKIPINHLGFNN